MLPFAQDRWRAVALCAAWGVVIAPLEAQVRLDPAAQIRAAQEAKPAPATEPKPDAQGAAAVEAAAPLVGGLNLQNANLLEVIDQLARTLKINYILDSRAPRSGVTLNTYGEAKDIDARALLDTILRINGLAMVQAGSIWRIVPLAELARMPLRPEVDASNIPEDDRPMLNLVFLKYANVDELSKLIGEFLGPDGKAWAYAPANLLLVLDSRRSMRRTMEMVSLFDSDVLAKQRVRLFETRYSRPADLAKEIEGLLKSMSLSKDAASVKLIPVDRINILIAVAPNPGVFAQVEEWINKLDVKVSAPSGKVDTYVYRVRYGQAENLSYSIMMLFGSMFGFGGWGMGGMGMGGLGMGGMGMGGLGMGGMGMGGLGMGGLGMGGMGMGGMGMGGLGMAGMNAPRYTGSPLMTAQGAGGGGAGAAGGAAVPGAVDQTGMYLGQGGMGGMGMGFGGPRVVPNINDNSLLILGTREEYESILKLLQDLDVPPRQVLIEAKIYEVSLTGAFAMGVQAALRDRNASGGNGGLDVGRDLAATTAASGLNLSIGALVGQSHQLLALLTAQENTTRTKVISNPSIIATDSIQARINVGVEVPVLTGQAVTGAQQGGSSLFANTISNRSTGVTLGITARVNPSGVVTLVVNPEISSPQQPAPGAGIQSPSFNQRTIQTQVTVNDGDLIAIGGIINETNTGSSGGVPVLHRIPVLGAAFGSKSQSTSRTELVVFLTPRVIYDTNQMQDASDELVSKLKRIQRLVRD